MNALRERLLKYMTNEHKETNNFILDKIADSPRELQLGFIEGFSYQCRERGIPDPMNTETQEAILSGGLRDT